MSPTFLWINTSYDYPLSWGFELIIRNFNMRINYRHFAYNRGIWTLIVLSINKRFVFIFYVIYFIRSLRNDKRYIANKSLIISSMNTVKTTSDKKRKKCSGSKVAVNSSFFHRTSVFYSPFSRPKFFVIHDRKLQFLEKNVSNSAIYFLLK